MSSDQNSQRPGAFELLMSMQGHELPANHPEDADEQPQQDTAADLVQQPAESSGDCINPTSVECLPGTSYAREEESDEPSQVDTENSGDSDPDDSDFDPANEGNSASDDSAPSDHDDDPNIHQGPETLANPNDPTPPAPANAPNVANPADLQTRGRKRKRSVDSWKQNVRRNNRVRGRAYKATTGRMVEAKRPKPACSEVCPKKCCTLFSEDDRKEICQAYYDLANYERQKDFICTRVEEKAPKQRVGKNTNKRKVSRYYSFPKGDLRVPVCQKFFCATLSISEKVIQHALKAKGAAGTFESSDRRGKHAPGKKSPERNLEGARMHIRSFPAMESHYCRKDSQRKYLDARLNIRKMHRDLYPQWCHQYGYTPVSEKVYRGIFNSEFNLGFHQPKKDQCNTCSKYKNLLGDAKEAYQPIYDEHVVRKQESNTMKEADKKSSQTDESVKAITFDLEAVLYTPYTDVSLLYYKRKLAIYNFTIYEQDSKDGYCFLWPESEGKRGADEIATCLLAYIRSLPATIHHIKSFSDTCGGQNRNVHVAAAMLYAVRSIDHLHTIDLKFMESGHSSMEVDSMHAAIERERKHQKIYNTHEWGMICKAARRGRGSVPYEVYELKHTSFYDFHQLSDQLIKNRSYTTDGQKINWLKLKWLRFIKQKPNSFFCKQRLTDDEFMEVNVVQQGRVRESMRAQQVAASTPSLGSAYKESLPISSQKKKDLIQLLDSGAIPEEYRAFYANLKCRRNVREALPEPDVDEGDPEDDVDD